MLVSGQGGLSEPAVPSIPGIDSFEGTTFHSARWNHEHDLTGERVAVIGTGASAIQFVPEIQPHVGRMHVFQRTAPWVMPHGRRSLTTTERRIYRRLPQAQLAMRAAIYWARETLVMMFRHPRLGKRVERLALRHMRSQVKDAELRRKLTPEFSIGCKRILPSNEWYPALTKPNVDVVTDAISEVRPHSIVTSDGEEREVDTIVYGTGFHVTDLPIADKIRGRGGRSLAEEWRGSPQAYLGTTVSGFPNLFLMVGPNTALGHSSIIFIIESQINYIADAVRTMRRRGAASVDVRPEVQQSYNAELERMTKGTVWVTGGCSSYYIDRNGHNSVTLADVHLALPAAHAALRRGGVLGGHRPALGAGGSRRGSGAGLGADAHRQRLCTCSAYGRLTAHALGEPTPETSEAPPYRAGPRRDLDLSRK